MSFVENVPVIQFTRVPKLVLARYDGGRPGSAILRFFGNEAKIVMLYEVCTDFWVDQTRTVIGHDTDWVVLSLGLVIEGEVQDPADDEQVMELVELVAWLHDGEIDGSNKNILLPILMPELLVKPANDLADLVTKEDFGQFLKKLRRLYDGA